MIDFGFLVISKGGFRLKKMIDFGISRELLADFRIYD